MRLIVSKLGQKYVQNENEAKIAVSTVNVIMMIVILSAMVTWLNLAQACRRRFVMGRDIVYWDLGRGVPSPLW